MTVDYEAMWDESFDTPCENDHCGKTPCYTMRNGKALCNECAAPKPTLTGLVRDNPKTPEGKYLVVRRDGTVVRFPTFVLGARDPWAAPTLRFYAGLAEKDGAHPGFVAALRRWADTFEAYRAENGNGDPDKGIHRLDDPATIELMKKGMSA